MYLLSGSFAYDTILLHKGQFHARILPEALSRLNVAFGIDSVKDEFGGTGGNIAYNASLLKQSPVLCSSVGDNDFKRYAKHLINNGLNPDTLNQVEDQNTAHAWILTDVENNQITGFSTGAMKNKPKLPTVLPDIWHLAPDGLGNTAWLAKLATEKNKKYYFDPGQAMPAFLEGQANSIWSLENIIKNSAGIFANEYEYELMQESLKKDLKLLLNEKTDFIVQTLGSKGLMLHTKEESIHIDVAKPAKIVDPTGCGDAFRAGFLYGVTNGWDIKKSAQLGSTMGSFAIEESGGQNHKPTFEVIINRFESNYLMKAKKNKIP